MRAHIVPVSTVVALLIICCLGQECVPPVDSDGDGITDNMDNCPNTPNTDQADSDTDGVGDACDPDLPCGPEFAPSDYEADYVGSPTIEPHQASMQPGQTRSFAIVQWQCCYITVPAISTACVQWSVDPPEAGTIDNNGNFQLSIDAQPGQTITIRATFPDQQMSATVGVYKPEMNPLVGMWASYSAISCKDPETYIPIELRELVFNADGTFSVTWEPFEVYYDYWGTYTYDPLTHQLSMTIDGGNYVPQTVDLEGTVTTQEGGSIRLDSIYFGPPWGLDSSQTEPVCGYILG